MLSRFIVLTILAMVLNSCGGGSGETKWGIDHSGRPAPVCNGDLETTTNAILVQAGQKVKKLKNNTTIRIWHYQNGEKKICVVQGEAAIYE